MKDIQLEKLHVIWDFPKNLEHFSGSSYFFNIAKGKGPLDTTRIPRMEFMPTALINQNNKLF